MKFTLHIFIFFLVFTSYAQKTASTAAIEIHKIEEFIIENKLDSAKYYLKDIKEDAYKKILGKIAKKEAVSYADYYQFIAKIGDRQSVEYKKVSNFINTIIKEPKEKKIDVDYVNIKWLQVSKLRDEVGLDEASNIQNSLESYVNKFDAKDINVIKAKVKLTTHACVLFQIQQDIKNGKALVLKSLETAKKLNDKELQIIFLYHLSDFLVEERKLQEYIDVSEESLLLEKELPQNSSYYFSTIQHLIDAYIYKGNNNERVVALINTLYNNASTKVFSYSLYAQLISNLDKKSPLKKEILNKFEVKNVKDLVSKFEILGKDLNSNDFYHVVNASSQALASHGFYNEAITYKDKAIQLTRKIYSTELSESLANYKTEIAVKEKEKEITHEKEKTTLYGVIALLAFVLFLITLFVLRKIKKQSRELSEKNIVIKKNLKEKELLVKEVHHRVKNNFQIVASLLELQTKGIEDERALELANEGKNRVKSMALIHQKLYQNETGLIDFDEYIKLLIGELSSLYSSSNNVKTSIDSEDMMFDVDTAIPLGLIINEIITNSYKYAFRNDKENNLSISIHKEKNEDYKLVIEDNGPGLANNFDAKKAKSLGLRLVNRLVKQLHGTLKQTNSKGAKFEIYFKDSNARQLVN
ncbi:sensor histidine kinase [Polaribacter sp.]|uniref:sensor histidine kinase n=1 Tax=Polaribacter sp. TaxID=1920175 RepID=UPI003EF5F648